MSTSLKEQLDKLSEISDFISENTDLYRFIKQINNLRDSDGAQKVSPHKYDSYVVPSGLQETPFLSVILRTQGNRPLGLREAFLSLRAQTCQDFEVIVIAHKATAEGKQVVRDIIESQPNSFQTKVKYLELDEGTRTTPINVGCVNAAGRYIAIYDDDDLLFENWVEEFYLSAKENDGRILHAFVLAQKWKSTEQGFISIEAPTSQFCHTFDFLSQLVVNQCPLMGIAFPTYLFHKLGFYFNEALNVTEDWEYLMRVVPITGVADIVSPTSIYRLWTNAESSYTLHSRLLWDNTYKEIQANMDRRALLIPSGYSKHLISLIQCVNDSKRKTPSGFPKLYGLLYYTSSDSFSDERMIAADNRLDLPHFRMTYTVPDSDVEYTLFRFDPCEYGGFILSEIYIHLTTDTDQTIDLSLSDCIHNGQLCKEGIYFLHYDPQIIWHNPGFHITTIKIEGTVTMEIPETIIQEAIIEQKFITRLRRRFKKMSEKILRLQH